MGNNKALPHRRVGRTNIDVTTIGLGGAWLGYEAATSKRDNDLGAATVLHALELGINLIDTSPLYGESEMIIGKALKEYLAHGGKRTDFVVSTKTGTRTKPKDYTYAGTIQSVDRSLELLGLDYVDFVLVHDPENLDVVFAPHGALEALLKLKADGRIRAIGLGVRSHQLHQACMENGNFDVSLTYGDYNLLNQSASHTLFHLAQENHVGIFNAMVVEYGLLSGRDPFEVAKEWKHGLHHTKVERAHELWIWAQSQNISLLSLALQYSTRDPRIATTLVGASQPSEIEVDVSAYLQEIPQSAWTALQSQFHIS